MRLLLPVVLGSVFLVLALWHFYFAWNPSPDGSGAVPSVGGEPVFVPSTLATIAVGIALLLCAALVAGTAGLVSLGVPRGILVRLSYGLALVLLARAVGEFKYVGFFKRVRDSRFATLDTWVYSPLCLLLAIGVAWVARQNG